MQNMCIIVFINRLGTITREFVFEKSTCISDCFCNLHQLVSKHIYVAVTLTFTSENNLLDKEL